VLACLADTENRVLALYVARSLADARAWLTAKAEALRVPESLRLWQVWDYGCGLSLELLPGRDKVVWIQRLEQLRAEGGEQASTVGP
jgi:hypothetical protein